MGNLLTETQVPEEAEVGSETGNYDLFYTSSAMYPPFAKKSQQKDLIFVTINGSNCKEAGREGWLQGVSEVFIITAYINTY